VIRADPVPSISVSIPQSENLPFPRNNIKASSVYGQTGQRCVCGGGGGGGVMTWKRREVDQVVRGARGVTGAVLVRRQGTRLPVQHGPVEASLSHVCAGLKSLHVVSSRQTSRDSNGRFQETPIRVAPRAHWGRAGPETARRFAQHGQHPQARTPPPFKSLQVSLYLYAAVLHAEARCPFVGAGLESLHKVYPRETSKDSNGTLQETPIQVASSRSVRGFYGAVLYTQGRAVPLSSTQAWSLLVGDFDSRVCTRLRSL
jgi:hypothetical protein